MSRPYRDVRRRASPSVSRAAARVAALAMAVLFFSAPAGAVPSGQDVVQRVLSVNNGSPDIASADVVFKLRIKKPVSDPPDCEFNGTMQLQGGRQTVKMGQRTSGLLCWAVNQYVLGRLFEASEPLGTFLNRFEFSVIGEKLNGEDHFYLVQGRARDPNNRNPGGMIGWVDYERGLVTDGRLDYSWGSVETEQRYQRVASSWALAHQLVHSSRFDATLEIRYSNFKFARSGRGKALPPKRP